MVCYLSVQSVKYQRVTASANADSKSLGSRDAATVLRCALGGAAVAAKAALLTGATRGVACTADEAGCAGAAPVEPIACLYAEIKATTSAVEPPWYAAMYCC